MLFASLGFNQLITYLILLWNKPVAQIPQFTSPISYNAPFCNRKCTCLHVSVAKWCIVGYFSNAWWVRWVYWIHIAPYRFTSASRAMNLSFMRIAGRLTHWIPRQKTKLPSTGELLSLLEYRWLNARLLYLQCISNGDTAVFHWAIGMCSPFISILD